MPDLDQRSFPGAGRGKNGDPLFDVGTDEVGEFLGRIASRVGNSLRLARPKASSH
jgi:hypothetical protein